MDELEAELMEKEFSIKQLILMKEEYFVKITELEKRLSDDSAFQERLKSDRETIILLNKRVGDLQEEVNALQRENNQLTSDNHRLYLTIKQLEEEILYLKGLLNRKEPKPPSPPPPPKPRLVKYYTAVLGDDIDIALAEYINAQTPEVQAKCFFFREGKGVYYYGTRRIFIKLEQGHLIGKQESSSAGWRRLHEHNRIHRGAFRNRRQQTRAQGLHFPPPWQHEAPHLRLNSLPLCLRHRLYHYHSEISPSSVLW